MAEANYFESAEALLRWSLQDAKRLQSSVKRYFAAEPFEQFDEFDAETGRYANKVRITQPAPETWRRLTFRIVCDLRHCLDQAMYAAVHQVTGEPPAEDIYFPWARDPRDLEHRMRRIPEELRATVRRLEPYRTGADYLGGDDIIYAARNIAGPNKHRVVLMPSARVTRFSFEGGVKSGDWQIPYEGWDAQKGEFTVIQNLAPGVERDYRVQLYFELAFGEVEGLEGRPVLSVLGHFDAYAMFAVEQLSRKHGAGRG